MQNFSVRVLVVAAHERANRHWQGAAVPEGGKSPAVVFRPIELDVFNERHWHAKIVPMALEKIAEDLDRGGHELR